MRRLLSATTAAALISAGLVASTTAVGNAAIAAADSPRKEPTGFALFSAAYGTRLDGGQVPAGSDATAYNVIGCTQMAGVERDNFEADATVPGLGEVEGVYTRLYTEKKGNATSSYSTHSIAQITIDESPLGSVLINGIQAVSRAFHAGGFKATATTKVASVKFQPPAGPAQEFDVPTPGRPVTIPGIARIAIGDSTIKKLDGGIQIFANALKITVFPSDTVARVAHTSARIERGIKSGIFRGFAASTRARGLQDNVRSGRTPLTLVPCQGTKGEPRTRAIAHVNLGDQIIARGLDTVQVSRQTRTVATGSVQGKVAEFSLGGDQLVVNAVRAQANVTRKGRTLVRDSKGTTIGSLFINGEERRFPPSGVLEIPGVARLEENLTTRIANGISVIGLRITLLDGSLAEIDLGIAELQIRRARQG